MSDSVGFTEAWYVIESAFLPQFPELCSASAESSNTHHDKLAASPNTL